MRWLKEWWHSVREAIDRDIDAHVHRVFGDLLRSAELGDKYERLERYYPNILARLNDAADRKEKVN